MVQQRKHTETFEERLSKERLKIKEAAGKLPPGPVPRASSACQDCVQHPKVAELQSLCESLLILSSDVD